MNDDYLRLVFQDTLILEGAKSPKDQQKAQKAYFELLEVIDDEGKALGSAPRGLCHHVGLRHKTVFVMIANKARQLLLQTRPSCLATPPSMKKGRMGADVLTQRSSPNSAV